MHTKSKSAGNNKKSAVSNMLVEEKTKQMKKPLILHTDEDSDEDEYEYEYEDEHEDEDKDDDDDDKTSWVQMR